MNDTRVHFESDESGFLEIYIGGHYLASVKREDISPEANKQLPGMFQNCNYKTTAIKKGGSYWIDGTEYGTIEACELLSSLFNALQSDPDHSYFLTKEPKK